VISPVNWWQDTCKKTVFIGVHLFLQVDMRETLVNAHSSVSSPELLLLLIFIRNIL